MCWYAARPCFAVRTTAVCRGCFAGNSGTTPSIAHGFLSRVVGSGGPEGEARRRSPTAKPEGEARRRSPKAKPQSEAPPKSRPILLTPLKRPTPTNTENSAQRTASRGGTRVITASSLVEPPAIAIPRASQDETDEETGTREARRNSTKESCQQAHTYSVHDRRRDANKGGTPIKSNIRGQGNPEPQPPQTTPDRAHHHKKSKARPEPTERPTKRPSDRPGGDIPCR